MRKKKGLKILFSILAGLFLIVFISLVLFLFREIFFDWLPREVLFLMIAFVIGVIILFSLWGDPGFPLIILWCLIAFGEAYFNLAGKNLTIIIGFLLGVIAITILSFKIYRRLSF